MFVLFIQTDRTSVLGLESSLRISDVSFGIWRSVLVLSVSRFHSLFGGSASAPNSEEPDRRPFVVDVRLFFLTTVVLQFPAVVTPILHAVSQPRTETCPESTNTRNLIFLNH